MNELININYTDANFPILRIKRTKDLSFLLPRYIETTNFAEIRNFETMVKMVILIFFLIFDDFEQLLGSMWPYKSKLVQTFINSLNKYSLELVGFFPPNLLSLFENLQRWLGSSWIPIRVWDLDMGFDRWAYRNKYKKSLNWTHWISVCWSFKIGKDQLNYIHRVYRASVWNQTY